MCAIFLFFVTYTIESAEERQMAWIYRAALGETGDFSPNRSVCLTGIERVRMKVSITLQPEECGKCYVEAVEEFDWCPLFGSPTANIWRDLVVF